MNKIMDYAWASGFYEGEGHIRNGYNGGTSVTIQQVNKEPLEKIQSIFGGTIYGPITPLSKNSNQYYNWSLSQYDAVNNFVWKIFPWLSEKKATQAIDCIEYKINIRDHRKEFCKNDHKRSEHGYTSSYNGKIMCSRCALEGKIRRGER